MKIIVYEIELKDMGRSAVELVQDYAADSISEEDMRDIAYQMVAEFAEGTGLHATFFAWKYEK